jgi:nitrous oxidase accessory protein NosD
MTLPTVTIQTDGTISPSTAPLTRNGNVYTFTANYSGSLIIARDDVVVDGADYTLSGNGSITESDGSVTFIQFSNIGILLNDRNNVEIKNLKIMDYLSDVLFNGSCARNSVHGNTFVGNIGAGIFAPGTADAPNDFADNRIFGNNFTSLESALALYNARNNVITQNVIQQSGGLTINYGSNNTISQNQISPGGLVSIGLSESVGNYVTGNTLTGASIEGGVASIIAYNNITGNQYGISGTVNSTIFENNIAGNAYGIFGDRTENNFIYRNNFINNTVQAGLSVYREGRVPMPANTWNNGTQGNFWSDYNGTDSNNNGIGDMPYIIDANNRDNYPLMSQVNISAPLPSPASSTSSTNSPSPTTISTPTSSPNPVQEISPLETGLIVAAAIILAGIAAVTVASKRRRQPKIRQMKTAH